MMYVLSFLILFLIGIIIFLTMRLIKVGEQLLELDNINEQAIQSLDNSEIILRHTHKELTKISKYPVVSGEPIVTHLISVVNIAKNEIQSILDDLINSNKE